MTATTAHAACQHPKTKTARAICRRERATILTVETAYGTFEIKTVKAKDLKTGDQVLTTSERLGAFFSPVAYDAHMTTAANKLVTDDLYLVVIGGSSHTVKGETEYTIAVDAPAVKKAAAAANRAAVAKLRRR